MLPLPNERLLWPNFRSPLFWDLTAILTYLSGSVVYLYLPLVPDLADIAARSAGFKRRVYKVLSLGWTGSDRQWQALERAMKLMAVLILAVAVSVHSVVAYDFSMSIAPTWHSTLFAPYFVVGAIFSGIAALVLVMAALRKALRLEEYLRETHFVNLGKLLLLISLVWLYFPFSEHLTTWYGNAPSEIRLMTVREHGLYGVLYWTIVVCNFVVPFVLLGISRLRNIRTIAISGATVLVGMWLERFLIVVPTLATPALAAASGSYAPSWMELSITAGTFAAMILLYLLFVKAFPSIAIWEYDEGIPARSIQQPRGRRGLKFAAGRQSTAKCLGNVFPAAHRVAPPAAAAAQLDVAGLRLQCDRRRWRSDRLDVLDTARLSARHGRHADRVGMGHGGGHV